MHKADGRLSSGRFVSFLISQHQGGGHRGADGRGAGEGRVHDQGGSPGGPGLVPQAQGWAAWHTASLRRVGGPHRLVTGHVAAASA